MRGVVKRGHQAKLYLPGGCFRRGERVRPAGGDILEKLVARWVAPPASHRPIATLGAAMGA